MASTDLTDFRNQFLTRAKADLLAVDLSTANNTTLIINAALLRGYDSVNKFDAIGPDAIYPLTLMTGAELDTYLSDPANAASFEAILASTEARTALVNSSTAFAAVLASSTAFAAVLASSTAMTAVAASSTAFAAVLASSTAMTAVWASDTAADAVLTSSTAKLAVYNADIALAALQANPTQVQRQIGINGRCVSASTSTTSFTYAPNSTKVILLRVWTTGGNEDLSLRWGRGLTTDDVAGGVRLPNGDNLGVVTVALGRTTTYANSATYPNANNANANVVSAANGLLRGTWSLIGSTTQNVIYITV
jgi:hypothetical protein